MSVEYMFCKAYTTQTPFKDTSQTKPLSAPNMKNTNLATVPNSILAKTVDLS